MSSPTVVGFICPVCHGSLLAGQDSWVCTVCSRRYPLRSGIPDFLEAELSQAQVSARRVRLMDRSMGWLASIYESRLWYPFFINVIFGWNRTSLEQIASWIREAIPTEAKSIVDVACGPATYGRRLAQAERAVYGIDLSLGMLLKGKAYLDQEGIRSVFLARSLAEKMPFPDGNFDAAICAGSLHLFSDPGSVLREIQRTLKPGSPLAVMTLIYGGSGILRFNFIRERLLRGMRVFEPAELEELVSQVGFGGFQGRMFGSGIFFVAYKLANG